KLMTLYLACEDLDAGRADVEEIVTVSRHAATVGKYRMGLRTGEEVPLRVLLEGGAIASANDAARALAARLAGGEPAVVARLDAGAGAPADAAASALAERRAGDAPAFVARMNDKARELGLTGTRFTNPHGLPDPIQRSNARDLATLTRRLIHDYPMSRPLLGGQTFVYRGRVYARHIPLFSDPGGVQALKTGFTQEAGYNL